MDGGCVEDSSILISKVSSSEIVNIQYSEHVYKTIQPLIDNVYILNIWADIQPK